jgi:hypothetical protein
MEVYTSRKPVNQRVTVAATGVLAFIAVLQSVSMVDQKWNRREEQLGDFVDVDSSLRVRVPKGWKTAGEVGSGWLVFKGALGSPPEDYQLWIQRIGKAGQLSREELYRYALSHLGIESSGVPQLRQECQLGGTAVQISGPDFVGPGGSRGCVRLIIAPDVPGGTTILMVVAEGHSDGLSGKAGGLLRHIAETAQFGDSLTVGKRSRNG